MKLTLQKALLAIVGLAILAGVVPAWLALDRRMATELETRARDDLMLAPRVLLDRMAASSDAMMMRAKDIAHAPGLAGALSRGDRAAAIDLAAAAVRGAVVGAQPVLVGPGGETWAGPSIDDSLITATSRQRAPVVFVADSTGIERVALAPVEEDGHWTGAAGLATPMDAAAASALATLTRSQVVVVTSLGRTSATTVGDSATGSALAARTPRDGGVRDVQVVGARYLATTVPLGSAGAVVFARNLQVEMAVLPSVRRAAAVSAVVALGIALLLGALLASLVARPVRQLSVAAERMTQGDFDAPLPASTLREVAHVSRALDAMRQALATRLADLQAANTALEDRTQRLTLLQAELMQRDRLAATGRLVTQLAHEIRNPVASLRNLIELLKRRLAHDPEGEGYARLAIDELHRMHRLAEQLLDLNRPRDPAMRRAAAGDVAREVVELLSAGRAGDDPRIAVCDADHALAAIAPDALKQVLMNVLQNALEAVPGAGGSIDVDVRRTGGAVVIEVCDTGPGIPPAILPRIFDPFFTTKEATHGVGLGLFVAEGLVRAAGGRITAVPGRREGEGAPRPCGTRIRIELPPVSDHDQPRTSIVNAAASSG